jgi:hypothetical protein
LPTPICSAKIRPRAAATSARYFSRLPPTWPGLTADGMAGSVAAAGVSPVAVPHRTASRHLELSWAEMELSSVSLSPHILPTRIDAARLFLSRLLPASAGRDIAPEPAVALVLAVPCHRNPLCAFYILSPGTLLRVLFRYNHHPHAPHMHLAARGILSSFTICLPGGVEDLPEPSVRGLSK